MDDALLHHGELPNRGDRLGEAFEAVADRDAHVGDDAVLQLGEHLQLELGAFTAVAGPQPEDVAFPGHAHPDDLVATTVLTAPFSAARAALLPDVLPDDRYVVATAIGNITDQGAQVLGFAAGGGLVAALGASATLGVDAASFAASALLLRVGLVQRPASAGSLAAGAGRHSPVRSAAAGMRLIAAEAVNLVEAPSGVF